MSAPEFIGGSVVLAVLAAGTWQVLAWILRWHRHRWFLHSFDTGPMTDRLSGAFKGQWITACLECSRCGKRKLVEQHAGRTLHLASREEAMVWVRSQCVPAPSHLPEQLGEEVE